NGAPPPGFKAPRKALPRRAHGPRRLLTGAAGPREPIPMSAQPAIRLPAEAAADAVALTPESAPLGPPVSVIVPCYDEAEGLPALIERLESMERLGWEVVFIDDGSRDTTFRALLAAARTRPWRH